MAARPQAHEHAFAAFVESPLWLAQTAHLRPLGLDGLVETGYFEDGGGHVREQGERMRFVLVDGSGEDERDVVMVDGDEGGEWIDDAAEEEGEGVRLFGGEGV